MDDVWFGGQKVYSFPEVNNIRPYQDTYQESDGYLVAVYVRLDKQYNKYTRKVTTFLQLLASIGGLQKALFVIGVLLVNIVGSKVFLSYIIQSVFQIRKYENIRKEGVPLEEQRTSSSKAFKDKENILQREFETKKEINDTDVNSLFYAFLNRDRFAYSVKQLARYFFRCLWLRDLSKGDYKKSEHYLFRRAERKLLNELDVVRVVKTLRKFKILAKAMLQ